MSRALTCAYAACASLMLIAGITGCSSTGVPLASTPPSQSVDPTPTPSPVTEEAAVAEALVTINHFGSALAVIGSDPSVDVSTMAPYVTPGLLDSLHATVKEFRDRGNRSVGVPVYSHEQVLQYSPPDRLSLLICRDITGVRIIDPSGADVTPVDRGNLFAMKIELVRYEGVLRVDSSEGWNGSPPC